MHSRLFSAALVLAALFSAALFSVALPAGAQAVKTFSTFGGSFAVSQTSYDVAVRYDRGATVTASKTDDLERLFHAAGPGGPTGPLTISYAPGSPVTFVPADNPLPGLLDAGQGAPFQGITIFGGDVSVPTGTPEAVAAAKAARATVINFTFNDPAAPFGETLTGLGLTTIGTGDGREYYDVDFAYSTDGVTFTKFLSAQDYGATLRGSGGTDHFLQATGLSIAGVKVLQLTERPNISRPSNPFFLDGSAVAELDAFFAPTLPAAVPEASSRVSLLFGLPAFGLALGLGLWGGGRNRGEGVRVGQE